MSLSLIRFNILGGVRLIIGTAFFVSINLQPASAQISSTCDAAVLKTPIFWDADRLAITKDRLFNGDETLRPAYSALVERAEVALSATPYSVTDKTKPGPSGDLQDYVSLARYYWPDPDRSDGRPYIRKDGRSNPEINSIDYDRRRSQDMTNAVRDLSLAAYLSNDTRYADKAVLLAYVWFVDEDRRMNPNLQFAQNVPGRTDGREFGIIDTRIYWDVMDGLWLLQSADMAEPRLVDAVRAWFANYSAWLITSDFGKKAKSKTNNHGSFYDAQLAHSLIFAGRCDLAEQALKSGHDRTRKQVQKSGLLPGEIERTRSLFYHAFNAEAFLRLSYLSEKLGRPIYDKNKLGAGSISDTVKFIASYAGRTDEWPYEEISENVNTEIWKMLKLAQMVDDDPMIDAALEKLGYDDPENELNLLIPE